VKNDMVNAYDSIPLAESVKESLSEIARSFIDDGKVIGIHEGGKEATLAYAIPLDHMTLKEWFDIE